MTVVQRVFKDLPQKPGWLNAIQQSPYYKCPKTYYAIVLVLNEKQRMGGNRKLFGHKICPLSAVNGGGILIAFDEIECLSFILLQNNQRQWQSSKNTNLNNSHETLHAVLSL